MHNYNTKIKNTLSGNKEDFVPVKNNEVSIYACGVTLYDDIHIGHLKSIISFEVMRNYFSAIGYKVTFVRNITDVDDKIILKASKENKSPLDLVNFYIDNFHKQLEDLEISPPDIEPRVTTSMETILKFISKLQKDGYAYETNDGIYFDSTTLKYETYPLSKHILKNLNQSRISNDNFSKKNDADFALWKEDINYGFPSNVFKKLGRPGWHIECSAMHYEAFGSKFDIHGGGRDLIFPHHENEIIQSVAHNGVNPANYWIHNGMMMKDGQKLSKSLGNSIYVKDLTNQYSSQALKLFLLKGHYASSQEFEIGELQDTDEKWKTFIEQIPLYYSTGEQYNLYQKSLEILSDDFNTPEVLSLISNSLKELNKSLSIELANEIFKVFQLLSVVSPTKKLDDYFIIEQPPAHILELMEQRLEMRLNKKFKESDILREQILEQGWIVKDNKESYSFRKR